MRLLLVSDLHADVAASQRIVELARGADVVVGAGDFARVRRSLNTCIDVLREIVKPVVLVSGNNETTDELVAACRDWPSARVLHGSGAVIGGVEFFGLGGGVPVTPFGAWSYDFAEEQAAGLLAGCPAGCVLVCHSPPKGAVDQSSSGQGLGSTAIRDCILAKKPILAVCGHIHGCAGQQAMLGGTPVVNAGREGMLWELAG